jgi:hypothetical protein
MQRAIFSLVPTYIRQVWRQRTRGQGTGSATFRFTRAPQDIGNFGALV